MAHHSIHKNRIILIIFVLIFSLAMVGVALAAANHTSRELGEAQNVSPQVSPGGLNEQALHAPPVQSAFSPPTPQSQADPLLEQMRLQAMSASQAQALPGFNTSRVAADGEAFGANNSVAPQGAGTLYLPGGIVVDTSINRFYGTSGPYANIVITRSDGAYATAQADDTGFFWSRPFDGAGQGLPVGLSSGDELLFDIDGNTFTYTVGEIPQGFLDVNTDLVSGNLPGVPLGTPITITLGLYGQPSNAYGHYMTGTLENGDFSITLSHNIGPENFALIDYKYGDIIQRAAFFPQNVFLIHQHGRIYGYAPRNNNVHATVYIGEGPEIRWESDTWAGYPYGWFTFYNVLLDIGDRVVVDFPGGSTEMHYAYSSYFTFSGDDTVNGNMSATNSAVRVSFLEWDGSGYTYTETNTTSDEFGDFTAIFPGGGIRPDTRVDVAIMDPSGAGSFMSTGQPYIETIKDYSNDLNCVWGRVDKPNADMTLELEREGVIYPRDPFRPITSDPGNMAAGLGMCFNVWYDDGNGLQPMEFWPGDILRLKTDTWSGEVIFYEIHVSPDASTNQIRGEVLDGPTDGEVAIRVYQTDHPHFGMGTVSEARSPLVDNTYLVSFDSFDVRAGIAMNTFVYDPLTGNANQLQDVNHYFQTIDNLAVAGHTYIPEEPITLRLLDPGTYQPIYTTTNDLDAHPNSFYFDFLDCNPDCAPNPPLQPGTIVEVEYGYSGDGDWELTYQPISVEGDPEQDLIYGNGRDGMLGFTAGYDQVAFDQMAPALSLQAVVNTGYPGYYYDLGWGDSASLTYRNELGNTEYTSKLLGEIRRVEFWMQPNGQAWIWGTAQPSSEVVIQTSRGDTLYGYTEALNGNFGTSHSTLLIAGDLITVTAGAGEYPVTITIPDVAANSDSVNETVSGKTGLSKELDVEVYPGWKEDMKTTRTDAEGNFSQSFADVPHQGRGYIRFIDEVGSTLVDAIFHKPFYDVVPSITANYAHDWVESQYDPGYAVAITVTDELGEVKATAHGETAEIPWWGGDTGISTDYNVPWDGPRPDLQAFDTIYLDIGGRTAELHLGEISGELDVDADVLTGVINAPWLTFPVDGDCGVWVENGPGMPFTTDDQGNFTCDFMGIWDLIPGVDVGVGYYESQTDGDKTYNVFQEPAPHLYINMQTQGEPANGNNFAFRVNFNNDGWATAEGVVITQTFEGMTYLSDTSGYPHMGTGALGDPVTWQVGELPYNHMNEHSFFVFARIDDYFENVYSMVSIGAATPYFQGDQGNKKFEWGAGVITNDSDLNIRKWAWTWAPVAGGEFVYAVNVCNQGTTSSSEVFVTDNLPLSTTLVEWWAQYPGWEEDSASAHQLVIKKPSLPGYGWCEEVYISVLLDETAQPGENLHNEAAVWASSDIDPGNNFTAMDHPVGTPEYNLHLSPNWVQGQFVPGGQVSFEFNYQNWGNMPITGTVLSSVIPPGTEFLMAYGWDWRGWYPIPDVVVEDGIVTWELGELMNGFSGGFGINLKIEDGTPPNTWLFVENRIAGEAIEYRYDDNVLVYSEAVNFSGSNLRVDKHTNWWWNDWEDKGTRYQQLNYEIRILNLGDEEVIAPIVTDTLPISTTLDSCGWNHGPITDCYLNPLNPQELIYVLERLNPGETASAMFTVNLSEDDAGDQGLEFGNQVAISNFDDVFPDDNHDEVISYTGPDVFVRKWLKEGEVKAGELITYTVEFGNLNRWPWNSDPGYGSHITDTLPAGMTFVRAIGYWSPTEEWNPVSNVGQQVVWEWGPMWAEQTWTFDLVAQIDEDVRGGTELLNVIDAWGDSPLDIEVDFLNNHAEWPLWTPWYKFMLPVALRAP